MQTTLYLMVQNHAASFILHTETTTGAELPRFIKDGFDAFLECGILAHRFLRLRCSECGKDKLPAFSCKLLAFHLSCVALRMSQAAAHLVDHFIPNVPVCQWVLSLPTAQHMSMAAQPDLVTEALRVVKRHLLDLAGLKAAEGHGGTVTLIQRFALCGQPHIYLHCLVQDGVYRCGAVGVPAFVEVDAPNDGYLRALLQTGITRLMKMLTRRCVLIDDMGQTWLLEPDADGNEVRDLRPLQVAAVTYRIAFGSRAGHKVLTLRGAMLRRVRLGSACVPTSTASACTRRFGCKHTTASGWSMPRPRLLLIRFHGVLAQNAKLLALVVPQESAESEQTTEHTAAAECEIKIAQAWTGRIG